MLETLIKNWWLLGLRGILALLLSIMAFLMQSSAATFTLREFAMKGMVIFLGMLAITAGLCTIGAGVWKASTGRWWRLVLDGVFVFAAGFALVLPNSLTFRTVTYIIAFLAATIGVIELDVALALRRHVPDEWFLGLGGAASLGFALAFLLGKPVEASSMFVWLGAYSGFSAVCMLALALRLRSLRASIHTIARSVSRA